MRPAARAARRTIAARTRTQRAQARARRRLNTSPVQSAKTHLLAAGLDLPTADRFAGAFSRGVQPTATDTTTVKLKGRRTKRVPLKLYAPAVFAARLAVYRPKDKAAAAKFAAAAYRLAA